MLKPFTTAIISKLPHMCMFVYTSQWPLKERRVASTWHGFCSIENLNIV
jgi:hypothetical protein